MSALITFDGVRSSISSSGSQTLVKLDDDTSDCYFEVKATFQLVNRYYQPQSLVAILMPTKVEFFVDATQFKVGY